MPEAVVLDGKSLGFEHLTARTIALAPTVKTQCDTSRAIVEAAVREQRVVYGVTTGFGKLSSVRIPDSDLKQMQENLVRSHAAGVGDPLEAMVARLTLLLKVNNLARGLSGVRYELVQALVRLYNSGAIPYMPSQGSVGASGDLAPLAHLSLIVIGDPAGTVMWQDQVWPAHEFLRQAGLKPITLEAKEGLSLINGTQVSCAITTLATLQANRFTAVADTLCALSLEAFKGSRAAFDPRIHEARGQMGQLASADRIFRMLEGSAILESHTDCDRVQDPYAFRCAAQVHGAARDLIHYAQSVVQLEFNAVTDNPLVFAESGDIISGGNFHAEPLAMAADAVAIAATELASISERRIAQLLDPAVSELPAFLIDNSGLNSGFMIAQVTAAALVSEMKTLAHPASVDSIPTSAGKEDHVSMATWAGRKAMRCVEMLCQVLAIELLAAAQGLDFRRPLTTSPWLEQLHADLRQRVPFMERDRVLADDIVLAAQFIMDWEFR